MQCKRDIYYIAFRLRINTKAFKRYKEIETKGLSKRDKFLTDRSHLCVIILLA